jgi:hypothetical protein
VAGLDDWGANTAGAEHNDPNLNHEQFKPIQVKDRNVKANPAKGREASVTPGVTPEEHAQHVQNIVDVVNSATSSERRAGARFYGRAHRDAMHVGQKLNPGMQQYAAESSPEEDGGMSASTGRVGSVRRGHERMPRGMALDHALNPAKYEEATARGSGAIAALSPSSPAGMDWEHNPTAAYEAWNLKTSDVAGLRHAVGMGNVASAARGVLKSARNRGNLGVPEAKASSERADTEAKAASESARTNTFGTMGNRPGVALHHAGNLAIVRAHEILTGEKTPEEALPMGEKTGHFHRAIMGDPSAATIDFRAHDITINNRMPADASRGLKGGRYKYFSDTHHEAATALGMRSAAAVQATAWIHDKNVQLARTTAGNRRLGRGSARTGYVDYTNSSEG